jgi:hypothetical protein
LNGNLPLALAMALGAAGLPPTSGGVPQENPQMTLETFPILDTLPASGPHPRIQPVSSLFGQFIGTWDMDVRFWDASGKEIYHGPGTWSFAWILDGLAIQDVLVYAPLDDPQRREPGRRRIGTSVRVYDPKLHCWRICWAGASSGIFLSLKGRGDGPDILIEGTDDAGALLRWSFTEIMPSSFLWTGRISTDQGQTWQIEQQMRGVRRPSRDQQMAGPGSLKRALGGGAEPPGGATMPSAGGRP